MIAVVVPTIRPESWERFYRVWKPLFQRHKVQLFKVIDGDDPVCVHVDQDPSEINSWKLSESDWKQLIFNKNDGVRNFGFLTALKVLGDSLQIILTLDDDVFPCNRNDPIQDHLDALYWEKHKYSADPSLWNRRVPISWFSTASEYMRGFPYAVREEAEVWVSHGVWQGVHDYDGPTQLVEGIKPASFYKGPVPKGCLTPVCFRPDQLVLMADGTFKPIGKIEVGDSVITDGGEIHPVIRVMRNHTDGGLSKITTSGFSDPLYATPNHQFLTDHGWVTSSDLAGKYVCFPKRELAKPILSDDDMYAIGLFLAEGCYVKGSRKDGVIFTLSFTEADTLGTWLVNYLTLKWGKVNGKKARLYKREHRNTCTVAMHGREVARWFLPYCGEYSYGKKISADILFTTNVVHLLRGLFDGDGHVGYNRGTPMVKLKTISSCMAEQVTMVCCLLGYQFGFNHYVSKNCKKPSYQLSCYGDPARRFAKEVLNRKLADNGYFYKRRNSYYRPLVHHSGFLVKGVEHVAYTGEVVNLTVQDNHTYIVRNAVVKNCGMNLAFRVQALPYVYFAPMGKALGVQRFADILMGVHLKRTLDELNKAIVTGYSTVYHERASNVFNNLEQEARGIKWNEQWWDESKKELMDEEAFLYFKEYDTLRSLWQELVVNMLEAPSDNA